MDPATATVTSAGISLYQAGGLALLLLGMGAVGITIMGRWFMGQIGAMGGELKEMRREMQGTLVVCIDKNTDALRGMRTELAQQTVIISQQNSAMRDRPCLQETGMHKALPTPLPTLRTP